MSVTGIDVAGDVTGALPCLVDEGYAFVARYYAIPEDTKIPGKILTPAEAQAISAAGLKIVAVWENGRADEHGYFTYAHGLRDGQAALALAAAIGQPDDTPIYFAVDFDATDDEIDSGVTSYFRGVIAAFGSINRVGAYASGHVCDVLDGTALASRFWLAGATGWAGYKEFAAWDILQRAESHAICALPVEYTDSDVGSDDYGGFQVPVVSTA